MNPWPEHACVSTEVDEPLVLVWEPDATLGAAEGCLCTSLGGRLIARRAMTGAQWVALEPLRKWIASQRTHGLYMVASYGEPGTGMRAVLYLAAPMTGAFDPLFLGNVIRFEAELTQRTDVWAEAQDLLAAIVAGRGETQVDRQLRLMDPPPRETL